MIKIGPSKIEEAVTVRKVTIGFPAEFKTPGWTNDHDAKAPFGRVWGRGVLGSSILSDGTYETVVGGPSSSHALLRQGIRGTTKKTFYFGFVEGTLYLENGSLGGEIPWERDILVSVAQAITLSGPLRGAQFKL